MTSTNLLTVYTPLIGWTFLGWLLGRLLPKTTPTHVGKFLFWFGVPLGIIAFLRHAAVSFSLWLAPVVAWVAVLTSLSLSAWICRQKTHSPTWNQRTQGSFLLASMVGNTGYIGFPVSLALVGPKYFAWALFYDLLGSTPAAYGLGVVLASQHGSIAAKTARPPLQALLQNPALWSFGLGLVVRDVPLPNPVEVGLKGFAWFVIALALVLVGMRLSQLSSLRHVKPVLACVGIKMVLVPLVLGSILWAIGITGLIHRVLLLQMAMPPAFATLVIAETYELDQELSVTALVMGSLGLLFTLPLWLWLFHG